MGYCCITQGAQPGAPRQPRRVGWDGGWEEGSRGRETYIYLWLIHADVWQKPTQHCKAIIFQLKEISFKKKTLTISQLSLLFSIQLDFYKFSILPIRVPANLRTKTQNKGSSDILKGVRLKEKSGRTSLVVQWLRLHTSKAGGTSLILGWGAKILHAKWHGQKRERRVEGNACWFPLESIQVRTSAF